MTTQGRSERVASDLARVSRQLAAAERTVAGYLGRRDELVAQLRAAGWSWDAIADLAGVTRQALMKRG